MQNLNKTILPKDKIFCFDIDGVIASLNKDLKYNLAKPLKENIMIVNKLYEHNKIILFTARGYETKIDWRKITENQMEKWGVKYHELKFGKPAADYYIDDKMLSLDDLLLWA